MGGRPQEREDQTAMNTFDTSTRTPSLTILNVADCDWENIQRGRKINIRRKLLPLDSGLPGVTVEMSYMVVPDGYEVPRHRHNCDQIRYIIDGVQSIGVRQDMVAGECGYFPEGVHYGPQTQRGDCTCLLMQFQGPSGERLLTSAELDATYRRMIADGAVFENGIYKGRKPDGTPQNKDSYAAIWEAHEGRKLTFPRPRYREPVMMLPDEFGWRADPDLPGIARKHLGTFSEQRTSLSMLKVAAGAALPGGVQRDAEVRYMISGDITYDGSSYSTGCYMYIPAGAARESVRAGQDAVFFCIGLPFLSERRPA